MQTLKRIGVFLKKHWKYVIATIGILLSIIGLFIIRNNYTDAQIKHKKIEIAKREREIASLQGKKELLRLQRGDTEADIATVNVRIGAVDREVLKRRAEVVKMNLEKTLDRYDKLGY